MKRNLCLATCLATVLAAFWVPLTWAAAESANQIPPEIENQAKDLEAKFTAVLAQECVSNLCTPVGCEVTGFKTLDEKQNSSLPGLDMSDESTSGELQYKLSSMRCEFAFEPSLNDEAVSTLRKRISDKVRTAGIALTVQGRKLSAVNPLLKEAQATAAVPASNSSELVRGISKSLPNLLLILALTSGLLALIWAARRLGKDKPVVIDAATTPEVGTANSDAVVSEPSAFVILNKKERLSEILAAQPEMATTALEPLILKGDVSDICRVLKHFGPEPLAGFSRQAEYRDLFIAVHQRYSAESFEDSPTNLLTFLEKLERLVALAQLGRPQANLQGEFAFLKDVAPDEFAMLAAGFQPEELFAILSFVPSNLRAQFLQTRDVRFVETYVQHVLQHSRLSEQVLRRLAGELHNHYKSRHAEIKKVSRDQLTQIEQMLNTLGPQERKQLYASLRKSNPALLERLSSEVLLDRALVNAPEAVLNDLFLTITPDEAAAYLQSHPDSKAILNKLKAPLAKTIGSRFDLRLNSELNFLDTADPLAEQARLKVNDIIKAKSARGEVDLRRINEAVIGSL